MIFFKCTFERCTFEIFWAKMQQQKKLFGKILFLNIKKKVLYVFSFLIYLEQIFFE